MSLPQISPLENRPFSFYPPILNIDQNEWFFRRSTWSEAAFPRTDCLPEALFSADSCDVETRKINKLPIALEVV
jgi:hypothetical protein